MALMGALVDNFRGPALDTAKWNQVNTAGNSGFQAGGRYTFIVQAGMTGDASLVSDVAYDLTGSHIHIELIDAGVQETGLETYPLILSTSAANNDNSFQIVVAGNLVGIYEFVAGVPNGLAFPAYNPVTMRWWRIRQFGGVVYFESASDVRGVWTVRASVIPSITITALFVKIRTFDYLSLATAKQTAVSNVNYLVEADLPFPEGAIPVGLDLAFGADIYGDQTTWDWNDVSEDFLRQALGITRGRANEANDVTATAMDAVLDNPVGDYTPDNPMSIYWPNVDLGTPARWWMNIGTPRLVLTNNTASRAQVDYITSYEVTGDLDVRIEVQLGAVVMTSQDVILAAVYDTTTNQRSWRLSVNAGGYPQLEWSTDGTLTGYQTAESTTPTFPVSTRAILRATLDVDDGAGGWVVTFYLGDTMSGPWTQVGAAVTGVGTTSIFASTSPLVVGNEPTQGNERTPQANVYDFQLLDGIGGTLVADGNFRDQVSGVPSFVDPVGLAWNMEGTAQLTDKWYRIQGTVDSWKPTWPWGDLSAQQGPNGFAEGEARVNIEIAGILRRLGTGESPLDSPLRRAEQSDPNIRSYWPMEDKKGSTQVASAIPGQEPMAITGTLDFEDNDDLLGSKPLPAFNATSGVTGQVVGPFAGHFIVDWYAYFPTGTGGATVIMWAFGTGTVFLWQVSLNGTTATVTGYDFDNNVITTNSGALFFTGEWTHLRLFVRQDGADVDWEFVYFPVRFPAAGGFFFAGTYVGTCGGVSAVQIPPSANLVDVAMGHIAVYDALNAQQDGAAVGWMGDTVAQRLARLGAEQGIQIRIIGNPATTARMGVQQVATLLELFDDAQDADGGILYEDLNALGLIYRTRESLYNQPPNLVIDGLQRELANPLAPILDDLLISNYITVNRVRGSGFTASDSASIAKRGLYDDSVTLNLFQDADLIEAAGWLLNLGTVGGLRVSEASTNLGVSPQLIDDWLTVDSGARIHLVGLPPQLPVDAIRLMAQGYKESISTVTYEPTANTTPAQPWDVFEITSDPEDWVPEEYEWRLDPEESQVAVDLNTTATTMFVQTLLGPTWDPDNNETPFPVRVNGERMQVTDIAAPVGSSEFIGAGNFSTSLASANFVAPSVVAPAAGDLLIAGWVSYSVTGTYTLPGGMFLAALTDGNFSSLEDATEVLGSSGATGTRTATFSSSDAFAAVSVVAHGTSTPVVEEFLNSVITDAALTITTFNPVEEGWWLLAINAWDWDPGNNMGPPSNGPWLPIADSANASADTSRVRAWARQITVAGIQSVTFPWVAGINDNHGRLYVISGVTGITQAFTVVRSVNGVVKAHPAGTPVELWYRPVLSR
jgi:hypothetical protein